MNDDDLILYYYGDGLDDAERAVIDAALRNDASLRERYGELRLSLDRLQEEPTVRAPADAVARWHRSIERAASVARVYARRRDRSWHLNSFAWGALAAACVAAIGLAYYGERNVPPTPVAERGDPVFDEGSSMPAVVPTSFARGVQVYLRDSRRDIVRLANDAGADRTLLLMDILRQNRLFEQAARNNGAEDVARVLRAFEPVLLRLASEDVSDEDAAALRAQLAFELNVVLTKLQQRESDDTESI